MYQTLGEISLPSGHDAEMVATTGKDQHHIKMQNSKKGPLIPLGNWGECPGRKGDTLVEAEGTMHHRIELNRVQFLVEGGAEGPTHQ